MWQIIKGKDVDASNAALRVRKSFGCASVCKSPVKILDSNVYNKTQQMHPMSVYCNTRLAIHTHDSRKHEFPNGNQVQIYAHSKTPTSFRTYARAQWSHPASNSSVLEQHAGRGGAGAAEGWHRTEAAGGGAGADRFAGGGDASVSHAVLRPRHHPGAAHLPPYGGAPHHCYHAHAPAAVSASEHARQVNLQGLCGCCNCTASEALLLFMKITAF